MAETSSPTTPTSPPPPQQQQQRQRVRRKIACRLCNARRVRCDAVESKPCSKCTAAGEKCELLPPKKRKKSKSVGTLTSDLQKQQHGAEQIMKDIFTVANDGSPNGSSFDPHGGNYDDKDGSEMLWAKLTDSKSSPPKDPSCCGGSRVVYLVEPFNLTYIVREECEESTSSPGTSPKMHYSIPSDMQETARNIPYDAYDANFRQKERELLEWKGAFSVPEGPTSDRLLQTYFDYFHPSFPIIDKSDFFRGVEMHSVSLMLLHAVYFIAATHCELSLVVEAGFRSREAARLAFYKRAKALFDADYEPDAVTTVQALFLMSFWWGGCLDQKDTWYWLGAAIGVAQSKGMHRSTKGSDLSPKDQKLWKRIWWSLYVRDRHGSASIGRPMRIHEDDCDVEMLDEADFEDDTSQGPVYSGSSREHIHYVIEMTKLSILLGNIIRVGFATRKSSCTESARSALAEDLANWEEQLPPEMRFQSTGPGGGGGLWASMLHIAYDNYLIYLYRPKYAKLESSVGDHGEEILFAAASRITRTTEDILTKGNLRCVQLHAVASIFAALSVHVMSIRRSSNPIARKLAENRAQLCILGLSELQDSWPTGGWILRLFVHVMDKLARQGTGHQANVMPEIKQGTTIASRESFQQARHIPITEDLNRVDTQCITGDQPFVFNTDTMNNSDSMALRDFNEVDQFLWNGNSFISDMLNDPDDFFGGSFGQGFQGQVPFWS